MSDTNGFEIVDTPPRAMASRTKSKYDAILDAIAELQDGKSLAVSLGAGKEKSFRSTICLYAMRRGMKAPRCTIDRDHNRMILTKKTLEA